MTTSTAEKLPPTVHPSCGTSSGYQLHRVRGESICEPCQAAERVRGSAKSRRMREQDPEAVREYHRHWLADQDVNYARDRARLRRERDGGAASREASRRWLAKDGGAASRARQQRVTEARKARTKDEADADFLRLRGATKVCLGCGELLPANAFTRNWTSADGRQRRCAANRCQSRHYLLKRSAKLATHWLARGIDPTTCLYCQTAPTEDLEHVFPKALGGTDDLANLAPACATCNRGPGGKHDRHPIEWLRATFPDRVSAIIALYPHIQETP
jgi:hypothetical protein